MIAIMHALEPLGVRELDMPATPDRVWQAIQEARRRVTPVIARRAGRAICRRRPRRSGDALARASSEPAMTGPGASSGTAMQTADRRRVSRGAARRAQGLGGRRRPGRGRHDPSRHARDGRGIRRLVRPPLRSRMAGPVAHAAGCERRSPALGLSCCRRPPTISSRWDAASPRRRSSAPATSPTRRPMAT